METKYFNFCINNGLKIYPVPFGLKHYKIVVAKRKRRKWKEKRGDIIYAINPKKKDPKWWEEIQKLYKHYYLFANDKKYKREHLEKIKNCIANEKN